MKIIQYYNGTMPTDEKAWTDAIKQMASNEGIEYELYTELPKGITLPEDAFTDGANQADLLRFTLLSQNPDWIWFDADVEPYKFFNPLVQGKSYFEQDAGIGIIYMNGDTTLASKIADLINTWKTGKRDGFPICQHLSIGGFIRGNLQKDQSLYSVVPDGYYNHHHSNSWVNPRSTKIVKQNDIIQTRIAQSMRLHPEDYSISNHISSA